MSKIRAAITGVQGYVPDYVLTNLELETMVDTNDEWIKTRTGISERRIQKGEGLGTSDMAAEAVKALLKKSNVAAEEIDLLICATVTGDMKFPATANIICDKVGIKNIMMLSGDKDSITQQVAKELNIENAKGGLLPEDKLNEVEILKKNPENKIAFIGDGINDAPVLAASNVGIAMGGLGSDVAIETADVIIQTDQPSKVVRAIKISRSTRKIVWQNIILAFGVKVIVLILGAGGLATMWEAVFADVGVALLAILNAVRLQRMSWD